MKVLVLGFDGRRKTAAPRVLYCGTDADAGRAVHANPPRGVVKTEFYKNPAYNKRAVHDPEREGAPVEEVSVKLEVEVLDLPMVKGLFALALEGLEDANKRLVAAGLERVTVLLPGELADLDEEDLAELKELRATEEVAKQMKALEAKLEEASGRAIAAEGLVAELEAEKVRLIADLEAKNSVPVEEKKEADAAGPALELTDGEKEKAPGGRKK